MEVTASNEIISTYELKQINLATFKKNPTKYYTPRIMYETIQRRDTRYYASALWSLWKQGFLIHTQRRYYRWNKDN